MQGKSHSQPLGQPHFLEMNNPFTCLLELNSSNLPEPMLGQAQTFLVGAVGCIRNGAEVSDQWTIDHEKKLSNSLVGL
jgi:hypothetical protein